MAKRNQTWWDIAAQEYGTDDAAVLLADANGAAATDAINAGATIECPESWKGLPLPVDAARLKYLQERGVNPGTANELLIEPPAPHILAFNLLLWPKMRAVAPNAVKPATPGYWTLDIVSDGTWPGYDELQEVWLNENIMDTGTIDDRLAPHPLMPYHDILGLEMSAPALRYTPSVSGVSVLGEMIFTPAYGGDNPVTIQFRDINGNNASVSPVVIMPNASTVQSILAYLSPLVDFESTDENTEDVRVVFYLYPTTSEIVTERGSVAWIYSTTSGLVETWSRPEGFAQSRSRRLTEGKYWLIVRDRYVYSGLELFSWVMIQFEIS